MRANGTPEQIRAMLEDGCSHREIARTLGASPKRIRRMFPGTGWSLSESARYVNTVRRLERTVGV